MGNLKSPFVRALSLFVDTIETVMKMLGVYEFLPSDDMMIEGGKLVCKDESPFQEVCANVLFLLGGYNSDQLNRTLIPEILANTPAGKSKAQFRLTWIWKGKMSLQERPSINSFITVRE